MRLPLLFLTVFTAFLRFSAVLGLETPTGSNFARHEPVSLTKRAPDAVAAREVFSRQLTNAARVARGLHVRAPAVYEQFSLKKRSARRDRRHHHHEFNRLRPRTSDLPGDALAPVTVQGYIYCTKSSTPSNTGPSEPLGYVQNGRGWQNTYGWPTVLNETALNLALRVELTYEPQSNDAADEVYEDLDMKALNPEVTNYPYVGAVIGRFSPSSHLDVGGYDYGLLSGTFQTSPGTGPHVPEPGIISSGHQAIAQYPASYQSPIWTYQPSTHSLGVQFVNSDGSRPKTYLVSPMMGPVEQWTITADPVTFWQWNSGYLSYLKCELQTSPAQVIQK